MEFGLAAPLESFSDFIELYVTLLRRSTLTPNPSPEGRGERRASPDLSSGFVMINRHD